MWKGKSAKVVNFSDDKTRKHQKLYNISIWLSEEKKEENHATLLFVSRERVKCSWEWKTAVKTRENSSPFPPQNTRHCACVGARVREKFSRLRDESFLFCVDSSLEKFWCTCRVFKLFRKTEKGRIINFGFDETFSYWIIFPNRSRRSVNQVSRFKEFLKQISTGESVACAVVSSGKKHNRRRENSIQSESERKFHFFSCVSCVLQRRRKKKFSIFLRFHCLVFLFWWRKEEEEERNSLLECRYLIFRSENETTKRKKRRRKYPKST